jgi:hypothetical protein
VEPEICQPLFRLFLDFILFFLIPLENTTIKEFPSCVGAAVYWKRPGIA